MEGIITYDTLGRMTSKQAVTSANGTPQVTTTFSLPSFDATKVHAMAQAQTSSELFSSAAQTLTYTGFDKVRTLKQGNDSIRFTYGYDHQRIRMQELTPGTNSAKDYVGTCEFITEPVMGGTDTKSLTYLSDPYGVFAVVESHNGTDALHYALKDNLGSWVTITNENGQVEQQMSFDAWGTPYYSDSANLVQATSLFFDRGFTGHEHLVDFDLINMNGRLYDPILGRMLSPDIVVQDEQSSQAYNRYSYCFNNPLRFTDPSGYVVRGYSSLFNGFSLFIYENHHNKGVFFNTDEALGQQLPKIEPFGEEEKEAYMAYRDKVFSDDKKYGHIQNELIRLENAEEVFRIRMGNNITSKAGGGNFIYNKETDEFDVNIADNGDFSTIGKIAHELKHADQYMENKLGFDLQTGKKLAYDINDEIEAFSRQGMFGKTLSENEVRNHPNYKSLPNMKSNLTIDKLQNMSPSYPFDEMKRLNKLFQEHNKVRFLYHGWQNDIK